MQTFEHEAVTGDTQLREGGKAQQAGLVVAYARVFYERRYLEFCRCE